MVIAYIEHALRLARFDKHTCRAVQKPRVLCLPSFKYGLVYLFADLLENKAFSAVALDCVLADA